MIHPTKFACVIILFVCLLFMSFSKPANQNTNAMVTSETQQVADVTGAWRLVESKNDDIGFATGVTAIKIVSGNHFSVAYFNKDDKKFIGTYGGTYTLTNGQYTENYEFNTWDSTRVGSSATFKLQLQKDSWRLTGTKEKASRQQRWERVDKSTAQSPLAGAWRITDRANQEGEIQTMQQGPRKTFKMLSGSRFQWIAYNTETKQFSGTGGGTYTAENGKYTETIEFFSRDSSRVGAVLSFDFEVKGKEWHHKGLSSTGSPIYEVWTKQ